MFKIAGINNKLNVNATKIPKDTKIPSSRAFGKIWLSKPKNPNTVVNPARNIGKLTLRNVFLIIFTRDAFNSSL